MTGCDLSADTRSQSCASRLGTNRLEIGMDQRLEGMDPAEVFDLLIQRVQTLEIMQRTNAKAARGNELGMWALNPVAVDPLSSLATDDAGFVPELGGDQVSITARFPIMNAIDCLVSVHELIAWRPKSGDSHAGSLLSLCRTATESSATTIWLLSSTDRKVRRSASVRFNTSELNAQRSGQTAHKKFLESNPARIQSQEHQDFLEHLRLFNKRVEALRKAENQTPKVKVLSNENVVQAATRWIDQNPPIHATKDGGPYGNTTHSFEDVAVSFYRHSSAIMHGLKWPLDYLPRGEVDMSRIIVDGVNIAVGIAECAVALFEAQAQQRMPRINRERYYPRRLTPTIKQWAALYPVHPATKVAD